MFLRQFAFVNDDVLHLRLVEVVRPHRQRREQQGGEEGSVCFMIWRFMAASPPPGFPGIQRGDWHESPCAFGGRGEGGLANEAAVVLVLLGL